MDQTHINSVKDWFQERVVYPNEHYPNYFDVLVLDDERKHYLHIFTGWRDGRYFYDTLLHIAIEGGQIVVYENNTDVSVEEKLANYEIDADQIVAREMLMGVL
ncbi:MAG: element excision factor XisI family protein [Bacteroidota bacterium]